MADYVDFHAMGFRDCTRIEMSYALASKHGISTLASWLDDPSLRGQWSFRFKPAPPLERGDTTTFFISDPDVAFAFRMRWC